MAKHKGEKGGGKGEGKGKHRESEENKEARQDKEGREFVKFLKEHNFRQNPPRRR